MRRRCDLRGLLALDASAMMLDFLGFAAPAQPYTLQGDAAVVEIQGPLVHHGGLFWDSYDSIHDRVAAACASEASTIVLKIDSPGGDMSGCFDTARELRDLAANSGKTLVAYVDGTATSAAYALACAASRIVIPETGRVGSIGVIYTAVDQTRLDAAMGLQFTMLASGNRKLDGNPHTPFTDDMRIALQSEVDAGASVFFDLVEELRGIPADTVERMQAGIFQGQAAVENGLADALMGFDALLGSFSAASAAGASNMTYEEAIAALTKAAEGDDDEGQKAKKMLAALDDNKSDDGGNSEPDGDEPEDKSSPSSAPPPKKDEESAEDEGTTKALAVSVQQLRAELDSMKAQSRKAEREALFASRPDLAPELRKALAKESPKRIKEILSALPRTPANPAAAATVQGTRGEGQGDSVGGVTRRSALANRLDAAFGLRQAKTGVLNKGNHQVFGAFLDDTNTKAGA